MGKNNYITIYENEFKNHRWIPYFVKNRPYGVISEKLYDRVGNPAKLIDSDVIKRITFFTDRGIKTIRIYLF